MRIALLVTLVAMSASGAFAQYQTVVSTGTANVSIPIPAGQVMQITTFVSASFTGNGALRLEKDGFSVVVYNSVDVQNTASTSKETYFVGPATIVAYGSGPQTNWCLSYKLFDNIDGAASMVPSTAVVIPADASGPVNIILESSTDLVTWTPASPGSYGSSTTKRFFRVRAVAQ